MNTKEFKSYIRRRLGYPVVNIEITDDQIQDAIDDAVQLFYENHYDGLDVGFIVLPVTKGIQEYTLSANIQEVCQVIGRDDFAYSNDPLLTKESLRFDYSYDTSNSVDLIGIEVWRQNLQNIRDYYTRETLFDFNTATKRLYLPVIPIETMTYALRVYQSSADIEDVFGDRWLKNYAVALSKKQWATNLQKYTGASMVLSP